MTTRRRFLAISAAAFSVPNMGHAQPIHIWQGVALGARATLRLAHPNAPEISARVATEISRLEDIFSLFRTESALSQLNNTASLQMPPFELLACLSLAGAVYGASEGRFDPTIQPLWKVYADASLNGQQPDRKSLRSARTLTGWSDVKIGPAEITMRRGMALTLNGIAQGYIADRVAEMLRAEGLTNILINTGEYRALGTHPDGGAWPVKLAAGGEVPLSGRALATSAPLGTTFDVGAKLGHILDPRIGKPTQSPWQEISISAPTAALADALSTTACLFETRSEIERFVGGFQGVTLDAALAV